MTIAFQKEQSKPHVLRCTRKDGSVTWTLLKTPYEIDHDLTHFAVEKTMGLTSAFYGLLESGVDINDFTLPKDERPIHLKWENLPREAQYSEIIVAAFQQLPNNDDFWGGLDMQLAHFNLPKFERLTASLFDAIILKLNALRAAWQQLPYGQTLIVEF
jgi:hypothetical protein